jgi:hypothetical protein
MIRVKKKEKKMSNDGNFVTHHCLHKNCECNFVDNQACKMDAGSLYLVPACKKYPLAHIESR